LIHLDEQSIEELEFHRIKEMLVEKCIGPSAAAFMADLHPLSNVRKARAALDAAWEYRCSRNEDEGFPRIEFEELDKDISRLKLKNATLFIEGVVRIYRASLLCNDLLRFFKDKQESRPMLSGILRNTWHSKEIQKAVEGVLDKRFKVRDDASEKLSSIRQDIGRKRNQVNRNFDRLLKKWQGTGYLGEANESFMNERRVLSVMSSYRKNVPGQICGVSRSGQITYVEPRENIQLNYELDALQHEEEKEIERILNALSQELRNRLDLIESYQYVLVQMDIIQAKVRLAERMDGQKVGLLNEPFLDIQKAYHPLLYLKNKQEKQETIPQDIRMDDEQRMLVISGPNAGGKSITLKTVGLLQVMAQSGLLIPVSDSSRLGWFHSILSDIGDNQSIDNQLSTYSYRLNRMRQFLEVADDRTLLLLDEFGTGSDPELGGALAEVFFEQLYDKGAFGVITTHYSNIKFKASDLEHAQNASMLFDTETLMPRYRLSMGQPGSSFTFEVAQMNGIPSDLIDQAKELLDGQTVELDRLIATLQSEKDRIERERSLIQDDRQQTKRAKQSFEDREAHFLRRLETQQKQIDRNNKYLSSGKKMHAFVDRFKLGKANKELMGEVKKFLTIEKTKIEEAKKLIALREKAEAKSAAKERRRKKKPKSEVPLKVGSKVRLAKSNQRGEVIELEGEKVVVMFGSFRTQVTRDKLVVEE